MWLNIFFARKCMYAKVPKTMGTCVPVGIEINGYWGKKWVLYPGCKGKKFPVRWLFLTASTRKRWLQFRGPSLRFETWKDLWSNYHVSTIRASRRQGQQKMNDQRTNLQTTIPIVHILAALRAMTIWIQFLGESTEQNQLNQEHSWKIGSLGCRGWKMTDKMWCKYCLTHMIISSFS